MTPAPSRFRVPAALWALTAVGLVAALVGDGAWDAVSWAALAAPLAEVGRRVARRGGPGAGGARTGAARRR